MPCQQHGSLPCGSYGTCINNSPSYGSYSCTCNAGYTGTYCQYGKKILSLAKNLG